MSNSRWKRGNIRYPVSEKGNIPLPNGSGANAWGQQRETLLATEAKRDTLLRYREGPLFRKGAKINRTRNRFKEAA